MIVITPAEQQGSGHCIVCENGIDRHVQTMVVDTLYDIELPGHFLDGRKYICQGCVSGLVRACGLLQATEVKELQDRMAEFKVAYQTTLDEARKDISDLGRWLGNVPIVPDVNYTHPIQIVLDTEAKENAKPKRGRPSKEPTF